MIALRPTTPAHVYLTRANLLWTLLLAIVMESVTCFFRFGFGLQSSRDTSFLSELTFGIRVHHGYLGILVVLVAFCLPSRYPSTKDWLVRIGIAMVLSDLAHHFLVLWPIFGDPQFDLVYPNS